MKWGRFLLGEGGGSSRLELCVELFVTIFFGLGRDNVVWVIGAEGIGRRGRTQDF